MKFPARLAVILLAAVCGSCHHPSSRVCLPEGPARTAALIDLDEFKDAEPLIDLQLCRCLLDQTMALRKPDRTPPRKFSTLVLSGGGMFGAYQAGLLVGWTEAGTRPKFDVVTGVSTGAFVATLAFLGPDFDPLLRDLYTTLEADDLFRTKIEPFALLTESLADTTPLRRLLERTVSPAVVARLAAEHASGRRLYVGTTQLDARRLVVWDVGAIAARGGPKSRELIVDVLLASASIPGFFPPVPIDVTIDGEPFTELHVDGGVSSSLFYRPPVVPRGSRRAYGKNPLYGSDLYIVVAGKLYADPACVKRKFAAIAADSISALIYSQTRGDLFRLFTLSLVTGLNYRLSAVPAELDVSPNAALFDPGEMTKLFEAGRLAIRQGRAFRSSPPGLERGEEVPSRSGTRLATPPGHQVVPAVPTGR